MSELPRSTAQESTCFLFVNCSTGIDTRTCMRILHSMNVYVYRACLVNGVACLVNGVAWGARPGSLIRPAGPQNRRSGKLPGQATLARVRAKRAHKLYHYKLVRISSPAQLGPARAGSLG